MDKFKGHTAEEIENRIIELSHSYTPEWHYDKENPDIGAAIARIFASQMEDNVGILDDVLERYHAEFVNFLDLTLKPAKPASSIVVFNSIDNGGDGTEVVRGTKLLAMSDGGEGQDIVFETTRNLFVTNSRLDLIFMVDYEDGSVIPLLGQMAPIEIYEGELKADPLEESEIEEDVMPVEPVLKPFTLFGEKEGSICRSVLSLYHSSLFDAQDDPIFIRFSGGEKLCSLISEGKIVFKYLTKDGGREFDEVALLEDGVTFRLIKKTECEKLEIGEKELSLVYLEALVPVREILKATEIGISSSGAELEPEFVTDGNLEYNKKSFDMFTDTIAIYNECFIGHDRYFNKPGAKVNISFDVSFLEKELYVTAKQEEEELSIIKRKPKAVWTDKVVDSVINEISFEYYNGLGWKKLSCDYDVSTIFEQCKDGKYEISFTCPDDWEPVEVGAYSGRCIKLQILKADNCYLRPAIHHYPQVKNMVMSFTYEGKYVNPDKAEMICGTKKVDITGNLDEEEFEILAGSDYTGDALYLGFYRAMKAGPISIFFDLEDAFGLTGIKCRYEYSTIDGFKPLRVLDFTDDFTRPGIVRFIPPSDMHEMTIEGQKRYYIRIVRNERQSDPDRRMFMPRIRNIMPNAISVENIFTSDAKEFFIDESAPDMHFSLGAGNILDAEVWVNEKGDISKQEIDFLLNNSPDSIRIDYNFVGDVAAVYVRWQETENFDRAVSDRCYVIDRLLGEIIFSDGIKCRIPRVTDDIAFVAVVRCTNGTEGNVEAFRINDLMGQGVYIDSLTNPVKAYGGCAMETIQKALRRGAGIIHSRNRLVSIGDYENIILNYSDSIDKVSTVVGETIDGKKNPADITFVVLMKDFMNGSFSFHNIEKQLKMHLLKNCEMVVKEDNVHIVEPTFVDISVNAWVEVTNIDDSFEIQNQIKAVLQEYLNPVTYISHTGWTIGTIPKKSQILMRLNILKSKAIVKRIAIICKYTDYMGEKEVDLTKLEVTPFMICRSGDHVINIIYD